MTQSAKKPVVALPPAPNRLVVPAAILIVLAATLVYSNSFHGALVFDDNLSINENPSIRNLWSLNIFRPPQNGATVQGRPMTNASLAVSYALNHALQFNDSPLFAYHLVNLLIHILAGLTLFGIVRRTLMLERFAAPRPEGTGLAHASTPLALAVAMLWTLHPLQTESVTYIVQRAESLMGLFYLLTLYCAIRAATHADSAWHRWTLAAVLACAAGMASKEVMVSAPLMVLLYDRLFLTGSWPETFRRRWRFHLALACTWAILIGLAWGAGTRNDTAGYGLPGFLSPLQYALNEPNVIVHYLRLALAPVGLCLDYNWQPAAGAIGLLPGLVLVGLLVAASAWAILRGSRWGFLGAWFFLILAPTSSIVPLKDLAFEHRMYLPLAAVMAAVMVGLYLLARSRALRWLLGTLVTVAAVMLGALTYQRNADYRSELAIWTAVLDQSPDNPRAHLVVAQNLAQNPRWVNEALEHYQKALVKNRHGRYEPDQIKGFSNRGLMYLNQGKFTQAAQDLSTVVEADPSFWIAWGNLAYAHMELGQYPRAILDATRAIELQPNGQWTPQVYDTRGETYRRMGDYAHAVADMTTAIAISKKPPAGFYGNRARAYLQSNQPDKARADADQCIRLGGTLDPEVKQALTPQTRP